jgi:NADH:ubiquinone oxidoreductase subunit 3 (subunit A)
MPGYPRMEKYTPEPTEEVRTVETRFVLPTITFIQAIIISLLIAYAWSVRKSNTAVISTGILAVILLHMYDHMYRVKRGEERFFL